MPDPHDPTLASDDHATLCADCGHPRSDHRMELLAIARAPYCEHDDHDAVCGCPEWREPSR